MDVSIYTNSGETFPTPPADRLTRQAARYKALFDVYRKYKANLASVTAVGPRRRRHVAGHVPGHPQGRAAALRRLPAGQAGVLVAGGHRRRRPRARPPRRPRPPRRRPADHDDAPPTTTTTTTTTSTTARRPRRPPPPRVRRPRPRLRRSEGARRRSGWSARRGRVASRARSRCRPARPASTAGRCGGPTRPGRRSPSSGVASTRPAVRRPRWSACRGTRNVPPNGIGGVRVPRLPRYRGPAVTNLTCS